MLLQLLQHLSNAFHVLFSFAFGVDEDVIKINYHKNVEFLCQDLADVILEDGRYISQSKRHYLVLKMAIVGPKGCLPFVAFFDPHLIIDISQIKLGETLSPT